ncbi:Sphingomyelin phosphodiesterase D [Purpureocillium takamizusanense]|uniref:Sphingomyelin phosphodiesterase D n=1 Tax=Purpureocillium takamizusanense TaxID=2060973 RepID=A0A9Q8QCY2_9HYPO|nr:Sphingomyelin phosphodiesterase D [Purpureocillium takamizusanense]UNI18399.1 Sphingomyelin phosphodiesterase D [Purpureocillium takamizusanense]
MQTLCAQALPPGTTNAGCIEPVNNITNTFDIRDAGPRPFYAIAHRVLTSKGAKVALDHGANALEIDLTAWSKRNLWAKRDEWWADHDGFAASAGDTAKNLFTTIAEERRHGKGVIFVWFDIKNPDYCDLQQPGCGIKALQELARNILQPAGVRVLYGFSGKDIHKGGYRYVRDSLNDNEAIGIDGKLNDALERIKYGPPRQVFSKGLFNNNFFFRLAFGNCRDDNKTCSQLRKAVESKKFKHVFGWTLSQGQQRIAHELLGIAGVDGIIYGHVMSHYSDSNNARATLGLLTDWLKNHPERLYMATVNDSPW